MAKLTPEGKVKADMKAWLDSIGAWYFMPVKHLYGRVGIPDIIICLRGVFISVEAKRPGNEDGSTPTQKDCANAIRAAGGIAVVATSVAQLQERIKEYFDAHESQ